MDPFSSNQIFFILREFVYPFIAATAVIWAPLLFGWLGASWWLEYVRKLKISEAKFSMLEIKIPKEVYKSPAAVEVILNALHGETKRPLFSPGIKTEWLKLFTDFGKFYSALWTGVWPLWWSMEIASIEGNIYFFIRCEPKNAEMIENMLYAQFPQAEITRTDDYTKYVPPFKSDQGWELRGCEYKLKETFEVKDAKGNKKKHAIDALPLKTYVDYGLHDSFNLEEEQKIDPLVPLLQVLGSLGVGEQAWIQIVVQGSWTHFENPDPDKVGEKPLVTWVEVGKYWIDEVVLKPWRGMIIKGQAKKPERKDKDGNVVQDAQDEIKAVYDTGQKNVPEREKPRLEATERKITKPGYDTGIRVIYIARKESFKKDKFGEIKNAFKQFNAPTMNSLDAINGTDDGFDYPWQDYKDMKKKLNREKMFKRYIKREFFYPPEMGNTVAIKEFVDKPLVKGTIKSPESSVFNTEELATLFHFPGTVAQTSGIGRIEAQKAEPPANLPI